MLSKFDYNRKMKELKTACEEEFNKWSLLLNKKGED